MVGLVTTVWAQTPADTAFTSAAALSGSAFPRTEMLRRYTVPTVQEQRLIDSMRSGVAEQVRSLPHQWSQPIVGRELGAGERERLLDLFIEVPVYFCRQEKCGGCTYAQGCLQFRRVAGGLGAALLLSPSLRGGRNEAELWDTLYWGLAQLLHEQSGNGESFLSREDRGRIRQTVAGLVEGTQARLRIRARCPGPFSSGDREFLEKNGILTPLNEFWEQCGAELMAPVRRIQSVPECARLIDLKRWQKNIREGWLSGTVVFRRCEAACETATCGNPKQPFPRFIPLATSTVVSLPANACEGARALEPTRLALQILGSYLKADVKQSPALASETKLCLAKLVPRPAHAPAGNTPPGSEAPIELNLIE